MRTANLPDTVPPQAARLLAAIKVDPEGGQIRLPFDGAAPGGGSEVWADASWSIGKGRTNIKLKVEGHVWIEWAPERGVATIQFHAPGLWRHGFKTMCSYYGPQLHKLLTGENTSPEELHLRGWNMTRVDLCADLAHAEIYQEDAGNWVGCRSTEKTSQLGKMEMNGQVETMYVGTKDSNCRVVSYDKMVELKAKATKSTVVSYRDVWKSHGWNVGEPVQRFEVRLKDSGLTMRGPGDRLTNATVNYRDPAMLFEQEDINRLWAHWTSKKRLVLRDRSRLERCSTDPRWLAVQAVAENMSPPDWRRAAIIADDAMAHRERLQAQKALKALAGFEALRHGPDYREPRHGPTETLRGILMDNPMGAGFEDTMAHYHGLFRASHRRQMPELGEVIQIKSDAIDEVLRREDQPPRQRKYILRPADDH